MKIYNGSLLDKDREQYFWEDWLAKIDVPRTRVYGQGFGRTWAKFSTFNSKKNTENLKPLPESKLLVSTIRVVLGEKICQCWHFDKPDTRLSTCYRERAVSWKGWSTVDNDRGDLKITSTFLSFVWCMKDELTNVKLFWLPLSWEREIDVSEDYFEHRMPGQLPALKGIKVFGP